MNSSQVWALFQSLALSFGGALVTIPNQYAQIGGALLVAIGGAANHVSAIK